MFPSRVQVKSKLVRLHRGFVDPVYYVLELIYSTLGGLGSGRRLRTLRVALVSDGDASSSEEQFNPFTACRSQLRRELRLVSLQLRLEDVLRAPRVLL